MKTIQDIFFFKRMITSLIVAIGLASCSSFYYHARLPLNAHLQIAFEDISWSPTSDSLLFKLDLFGIIGNLSPKDIVSVTIRQDNYESKATYKYGADNPFWYEIIRNDIEPSWFIEDNYCGGSLPDVNVIIILEG